MNEYAIITRLLHLTSDSAIEYTSLNTIWLFRGGHKAIESPTPANTAAALYGQNVRCHSQTSLTDIVLSSLSAQVLIKSFDWLSSALL